MRDPIRFRHVCVMSTTINALGAPRIFHRPEPFIRNSGFWIPDSEIRMRQRIENVHCALVSSRRELNARTNGDFNGQQNFRNYSPKSGTFNKENTLNHWQFCRLHMLFEESTSSSWFSEFDPSFKRDHKASNRLTMQRPYF